MARLDRLGAAKEVAQVGAVLGSDFFYALLHAIHPIPEPDLQRTLRALADAELLYVRGLAPDATYQFKHALIRDAAYEALLKSRRKELHRLVAQTIDSQFAALKENHPEVLARHWTEASELEPAIAEWTRAAQQAAARSAFAEAMTHARAGLALIPEMPADPQRSHREFELLTTLVTAATALEGWNSPQISTGRERMITLARSSRDETELAEALKGAWADHLTAGRYEQSLEMAQQMLAEARHRQNPGALADAHTALGWISVWMGRIGRARKAFDQAFSLCPDGVGRTSLIGGDPMVELRIFAAMTIAGGYPDRHRRLVESAVQRARELNQPFSLTLSLFSGSWTLVLRSDLETAERLAREGAEVATQSGYPHLLAGCNYSLGWALSLRGETERGIALIRDGIAGWTLPMSKYHHVMLAESHLRDGEYQEALEALKVWRALAHKNGEHYGESEAERFEAEALLLMDPGNASTAEQHLRRAIAITTEQGAKWFELRATTSLARLLSSQGRRDEGRAMLAEIYNWFTEGFDTADLKDAKGLLDELSS